jgi:hypothetical protein
MASKVYNYTFGYKINPYYGKNWTSFNPILMEYHDTAVYNQEELALNSMMSYSQSYYWFNNSYLQYPPFQYTYSSVPLNKSEDYCIHFWAKKKGTAIEIYTL